MEDKIQENEKKKVVNLLRKSGGQLKPLKGGQFVRFMRLVSFSCEISLEDNLLRAESDVFSIGRTKWGITSMSVNHVASRNSYIVPDEIKFKIALLARQ